MWWPWRSRRAEQESVEALGTGSPAPASAPHESWRALPALQRTTHEAESACRLDTFPATLSTTQDPRFLEPLGHYVETTAPAGRVERLAQPSLRAATEFALPRGSTSAAAPASTPAGVPSVQRRAAPAGDPAPPPPTSREPAVTTPLQVVQRSPELGRPETPTEEPPVAPTIGLDRHASAVGSGSPSGFADASMPVQRAVEPATVLDVVAPVRPSSLPALTAAGEAATADAPSRLGGLGSLPEVPPRPVPAVPLPTLSRSVAAQGDPSRPTHLT